MVKKTHRGVKTTIEIPEALWRAGKIRAIDEGSDFRAVVIEALEKHLASKKEKKNAR